MRLVLIGSFCVFLLILILFLYRLLMLFLERLSVEIFV